MNLKNTHKGIYQRLVNEDTTSFFVLNEEKPLITWDEYYERNKIASAIEEIMSKFYGEETLLKWRKEEIS